MNHNFTCNPAEIKEVLKWLKHVKWEEKYPKRYVDEATGDEYDLLAYQSEYLEKEIPVLKKKPWPNAHQVIQLALTSLNINEIAALSLELYFREEEGQQEFRAELIAELEKYDLTLLDDFEKQRLRTIIYESSLYDERNLRGIMYKSWQDVFEDAAFYKDVAQRASAILKTLKRLEETKE